VDPNACQVSTTSANKMTRSNIGTFSKSQYLVGDIGLWIIDNNKGLKGNSKR
jgi:hypothetical protein